MCNKKLSKKLIWVFAVFSLINGSFLISPQSAAAQNEALNSGDSDVPVILPRSAWDSTPELNALLKWFPSKDEDPSDWQPVERIILHDTGCDIANPTCNNNQNPVATIQSIYRYHAVTRGWGDIGYNYIIDQQGRIYEGRYGGNGSRGAHVFVDKTRDNFNFGTIGIAVLGNYGKIQPSEAVNQSLSRLVGWLAAANGLDPLGSRSSSIWNLLTSEFSGLYNGPIVVGHKDVEKGNPDPASFDFARIRREAANFAAEYKNYIYQADALPKIYKIALGTRQIYDDLPAYVSAGGTYQKLAAISQTQADIFSESRFLKYPDGSLLQVEGNPTIYLIENGQRRNLSVNAKEFVSLGFDFARVRKVSDSELAGYAEGDSVKFGQNGQLLSDGTKIFRISGGKKHWIPSGSLFTALGYSWTKVKTAAGDLKNYLEGAVLVYPDGTLVQAAGRQEVYLFNGGKIRQFISAEIFTKLKYSWSRIKKISAEEIAYYPQGDYMKYKEGSLIRPNDEKNVYLISGGKPQLINAATFKKKKYSWANVLVIAAQDFRVLYLGATLAVVSSPAVSLSPSVSPAPSPSTGAAPSLTPSTTPSLSSATSSPKIRIAIYEVTSGSATLTANTAYNVLDKSGQIIATKNANENYIYNIASSSSAFVRIMPVSADGAVQIVSYEDHPVWKPSLNYNQFRGSVEIIYSAKSNKIWAVNELDLEDYLRGIAEISSTDAAEYQKAMVVAARTYAQHYIQNGGKRGTDEVYILNNTTSDQLYKGYAREVLAPSIVEAVLATRGEIIAFNGQPIVAAYSSGAAALQTRGTTSACSLWGSKFCQAEFAYLNGGVKDPAGAVYNYTSCSGANHCVGLSGAGARAFAKAGTKNYQEILKYYYLGTEIKKNY